MSRIVLDALRPLLFKPAEGGEVWGRRIVLEPGFHVFHAPSGRGKTSLLSAIRGVSGLCSGSVCLEGLPPGRRPFSVLDQALSCIPTLSALDNLRLGLPGQELDEAKARRCAGELGIAPCLEKLCAALSRGELQRLLAIRAMLQESAWILLDEPCAHLDADSGRSLLAMFLALTDSGRPVVMTSLDPALEPWPAGAHDSVRLWSLS